MNISWVDILIVLYVSYFLVVGYLYGFIRSSLDLFGLVSSFLFAVKFYSYFEKLVPASMTIDSRAIGFVGAWLFFVIFYTIIFSFFVYKTIPEKFKTSKINHYLGPIPGFARGMIFAAILITLVWILPLSPSLRTDVEKSKIGGPMVKKTSVVENYLEKIFSNAINQTLTFLTVHEPESDETVELGFKVGNPVPDEASEQKMLELVNKERTERGLKPLIMDNKLREIAREYSKTMFMEGYFSHTGKDGSSPFDRMKKAGIIYLAAGENLALAPNVEIAHNGLMNSPGHRANILTAEFGKVGLGVMDGGVYGKMFVQEFTD